MANTGTRRSNEWHRRVWRAVLEEAPLWLAMRGGGAVWPAARVEAGLQSCASRRAAYIWHLCEPTAEPTLYHLRFLSSNAPRTPGAEG